MQGPPTELRTGEPARGPHPLNGAGDGASAAYLTRLAAWGYGLSEVEQLLVDNAAKRTAGIEATRNAQATTAGTADEPETPDAA